MAIEGKAEEQCAAKGDGFSFGVPYKERWGWRCECGSQRTTFGKIMVIEDMVRGQRNEDDERNSLLIIIMRPRTPTNTPRP